MPGVAKISIIMQFNYLLAYVHMQVIFFLHKNIILCILNSITIFTISEVSIAVRLHNWYIAQH